MKIKENNEKDQDYDDWEGDAQASFSLAANSEFTRLKEELKRRAGILPLPWYRNLLNKVITLFKRK